MFMLSATTLIFGFILRCLHEEDAKCLASPCDPLLMFPVGQEEYHSCSVLPSGNQCCLQAIFKTFELSACKPLALF